MGRAPLLCEGLRIVFKKNMQIHIRNNWSYRAKLTGFILLILLLPVGLLSWLMLAFLPVLEMLKSTQFYFIPSYLLGLYLVNNKAVSPLFNRYINRLKLFSKQLGIDPSH